MPDDLDDSTVILSLDSLGRLDAPGDTRHVLVCLQGPDVGKIVTLSKAGTFTIGRKTECELCLKYEGVSRTHAKITYVQGAFVVEDLGSSNGTMVGGRRIERHQLHDGDVIQLGPLVSVRYSVTDGHEENMLRHLYEASVRDPLTAAYNRDYLAERLRSEIAFSHRHHTDTSLVMMDLDHFKGVNDTYGHQAGDAVLVEFVKVVSRCLRTEDVLARYGGEEFAVSLRGVGIDGTARLAERLRSASHHRVAFDGQEIPVSVSIGCSTLTECGASPTMEILIGIADKRLYAAKAAGRNRVIATG